MSQLKISYSKQNKIIGYHGTYLCNLDSITENNFYETTEHDEWLGDGVYLFVDGIGSAHPQEYAWAYIEATRFKEGRTDEIMVLESQIKIINECFLDLTTIEGMKLFNEFRDTYIDKLTNGGLIASKPYNDTDILKIFRKSLKIEFVKSDLYIKFAVQRKGRMFSRLPNVTVLVVNNPKKNILKPTIKLVKKGG